MSGSVARNFAPLEILETSCIIELCAGTAAVSLAALGAPRFPVTRVGSKAGYAKAILDVMGIEPGSVRRALLVESDLGMANALHQILTEPGVIAAEFQEWRLSGTERRVWNAAKGSTNAAPFLIRMAGARGGVGGFKGVHKLRPKALAIPRDIERRIKAFIPFSKLDRRVDVLCKSVLDLRPSEIKFKKRAAVYIDPPYRGRMAIGDELGVKVESIAEIWHNFGYRVYVSEARPLKGATRVVDITHQRQGQRRRSLTRSLEEFISCWEHDEE